MQDSCSAIVPAPRARRQGLRPRSLPQGGSLVLLLVAFLALPAWGTDRLVSTFGTDSGDCTVSPCRTLQYALSKIGSTGVSGTVKVAQGVYSENVSLTPAGTPDITD